MASGAGDFFRSEKIFGKYLGEFGNRVKMFYARTNFEKFYWSAGFFLKSLL